ncbi:MAG: CRISPR-associated endonuclease Cas3'' [Verrucomicrobia bacterium]|nr:CRISPR-associated endonuclease Cas3'' [Verrucomicrobiota bacterium]
MDETTRLASALVPELVSAFVAAARWHDVGKAHEAFQKMLRGDDPTRSPQLWAKSAQSWRRCDRRFLRHELASALGWLQTSPSDAPERDLVAYLIAAHHGKVRLSLRSLPGEEPPPDRPDTRVARGILDGDPLGPVELEGVSFPTITLDLSLMEMGWDAEREPQRGPSWLARMIALRDHHGPFRLAWLETLLRAADARASAVADAVSPANAQPKPLAMNTLESWGADTADYNLSMLGKPQLYQQEAQRLITLCPDNKSRLDAVLRSKLAFFACPVPPARSPGRQ